MTSSTLRKNKQSKRPLPYACGSRIACCFTHDDKSQEG